MITNTVALIGCLAGIEAGILWLDRNPKTKFLFRFLPAIFWIYFTPLLLTHFGLFSAEHALYGWTIQYILPLCLILLLIPVDLPGILKLGPQALTMMLAGTAGVMAGTVIGVGLFQRLIPPGSWIGFTTVAASWMGGSSNMIAVKEAVGTPEDLFSGMIIVDALVGYTWMGLLMALSSRQESFNAWTGADRSTLENLRSRIENRAAEPDPNPSLKKCGVLILTALAGTLLARQLAGALPEIQGILSTFTWVIILVSVYGLTLSFSPLRRLDPRSANRTGNLLLYFVLTTIGAHAAVSEWKDVLLFSGIGFLIVGIHGIFLIAAAKLIRAPMFLFAAASQANIGGVASAPIVAAVYDSRLAPVGLLLAVFGNIIGTYLGITLTQICRLLASAGILL